MATWLQSMLRRVSSVKTDVFSFGVLLLEIISGKRNAGFHQQGAFFNLLGYVSVLKFSMVLLMVSAFHQLWRSISTT